MTEDGEVRQVPEIRPAPARDVQLTSLHRCTRCGLSYLPSKSTSALKLTYCSFLCELGDLGFSMAGLEAMQKAPPADAQSSDPPESQALSIP